MLYIVIVFWPASSRPQTSVKALRRELVMSLRVASIEDLWSDFRTTRTASREAFEQLKHAEEGAELSIAYVEAGLPATRAAYNTAHAVFNEATTNLHRWYDQ